MSKQVHKNYSIKYQLLTAWILSMICMGNVLADESSTYTVQPLLDTDSVVWQMDQLAQKPNTFQVTGELVTADNAPVKSIWLEGEPYHGKATRVFTWYGLPKEVSKPVPGIVLVHGAGGTAFKTWVHTWVKRGYAAIAVDTAGSIPIEQANRPSHWQRHPYSGPAGWGAFETVDEPVTDQWVYHAVAAVIRSHSFLRSLSEVDTSRIGITGISWGGFLTNIVVGVDDRFAFAVPVYGCGFLGKDSSWLPRIRKLGDDRARKWLELWDPSRYIARAKLPMLYVNGTNDKHYRLGSWQKTYQLAGGDVTLCCKVRMRHAEAPIGDPAEVSAFANAIVNGGKPMIQLLEHGITDKQVTATYSPGNEPVKAVLNYTKDSGNWPKRHWLSEPAHIDTALHRVDASIPDGATTVYLNLLDARGLIVSTPHQEIKP